MSLTIKQNYQKSLFILSYTATSFNYLIVESEIKANRPVILTGYSSKAGNSYSGGHCWVADGVHEYINCPETLPDGSTIGGGGYLWFHMNWGWGGQNNGWFGYASADSGNGNYQYKRDMVYSIYK